MRFQRLLISAALTTGMAALPLASASAQYYPPCSPFPLFWPFCAAGAIVNGAATILTAPFRAIAGGPYDGSYRQPYYAPPHSYYGPGYAYPPANYGPR